MRSLERSVPSSNQGFQTEAVVKSFDSAKGFGFVIPAGGLPDAFLHSSLLAQVKLPRIPIGTKLIVQIRLGAKGLEVINILQVLGIGAVPQQEHQHPPSEEIEVTGTVKWYKRERGFGFVIPDDGGPEVLVPSRILVRAGLDHLDFGLRVKMAVRVTDTGRVATSIEITGARARTRIGVG
jgi:CspA family cold shock protein